MALTDNLLREFAKTVNKTPETETKQKYYGTAHIRDNRVYVSIDGSKQQTPAIATVGVKDGERVTIELSDHKAYIVGTGDSEIKEVSTVIEKEVKLPDGTVTIEQVIQKVLSTKMPAQMAIDEITSKLIATKVLNSDIINTETIKADSGFFKAIETYALTVEKLKAATADIGYLTVQDLEGDRATIKNLVADNVTINKMLEAQKSSITELDTKKLNAEDAKITYATIDKLNADVADIKKTNTEELNAEIAKIKVTLGDYAKVDELKSTNAEISKIKSEYVTTAVLHSDYLTTEEIVATYATINSIKTSYAEIDLANVEKATIGKVLANIGLISSAIIEEGHVTGYLDSVEINANKITAGTLSVERLVISGSDKSIIYALNNSGKLVSTQVDTIDGDVITKRTISAEHIIANSITSNELAASCVTAEKILSKSITADKLNILSLESIVAKIGNFFINKAIYSNNHSAYNSDMDGVYIGDDYIATGANGKAWIKKDGSVSFGNGAITYDAKTNKVDINADTIKMGSKGLALEDEVNTKIDANETAIKSLSSDILKYKSEVKQESDSITESITSISSDLQKINEEVTKVDGTIRKFTQDYITVKDSKEAIDNIQNNLDKINKITAYISETIDGLEIGRSDSAYISILKSDRLEIAPRDNKTVPVAYFANRQLYITNATVADILNIGNFRFMDEGDNGLSLVHI